MAEPGEESNGAESEEQLREQLEQQVRELRIDDLVLQSAISILNLSARRIAKEDERDLDQARIGIEAAGALVEHVPEQAQAQLRQAVSELQLLWAKHARGDGGDDAAEGGGDSPAEPGEEASEQDKKGPGGGASGLWTPGDD
ncbi:MAG: hypothetical protein FJW90_06015 [Actinobacteria bacterium]|nr:hypothetical protein [Actinomycetota bacterium]